MEFGKIPNTDNPNISTTIASGAVVINSNKVLLTRDGKDSFWKFPGGTCRADESPKETAIRELHEETGLEITSIDSEPLLYSFQLSKDDETRFIILIHFPMFDVKGDASPTDEQILECKFFDIDQLPQEIGANVRPVIDTITSEKG